MTLPFPAKTRIWDRTTPNDGDLFDDEFDQLYANDNDLDTRMSSIGRAVGDLFPNIRDIPLSQQFAAIRIDQEHILNDTNHPDIFTELNAVQLSANGASQFATSGAINSGGFMRLQFQNNANNILALSALYEDALYHGNGTPVYANWRTLTVPTDLGPLLAGTYQIQDVDPVNLEVEINFGYQSGVVSGNIEFYPFRIAGSSTTVRWLAVSDSVIRLPGSDALAMLRLRDRMQGHWHEYRYHDNPSGAEGPGANGPGWFGYNTVQDPISDGVNGTPRVGDTTRDRSFAAYWYMYIGTYIP